MTFDGRDLTVSTGRVTRRWLLTYRGFKTVHFSCGERTWSEDAAAQSSDSDWNLGDNGDAKLLALTAHRDDDEGFTSEHLCVVAEFEHTAARLLVRYVVWAYPDAPGLRTQLRIRALPGYAASRSTLSPQVVESASFNGDRTRRRAFGLMQGIKTNMNARLLREEAITASQAEVDWANGVVLHGSNGGLILVKESNKHTHLRPGADVATGQFVFADNRLSVTGAGLYAGDIDEDSFKTCWATWSVLYVGEGDDGELALKRFDRLRYPIDPDRDIYVMANTWGSEDLRPPCLHAAREENVLAELESAADLGIDVLQIDDGWQTPQWTTAATARQVQHGDAAVREFGDYPVYPTGWSRVRDRAEELGVTLGLWAAWTAPSDALAENYDLGGFKYFKLDFAQLTSKGKYDGLARKARDLIKHSGGTARVNWDVTETATRMGYFSGREYGNVYLANRKTRTRRPSVLYIPHKVLNDAWHLSRYVNLNKFQVTVQNVDYVYPDAPTDADKHTHAYSVGVALMASPIFFQETRHYEPDARREVRELLTLYKQHRETMFQGYVFPVGDEPNNTSWTGFQNLDASGRSGYLTLFRERLNDKPETKIQLRFIKNTSIELTNLVTGRTQVQQIGPRGHLRFSLPSAPGFAFLRYKVIHDAQPQPN